MARMAVSAAIFEPKVDKRHRFAVAVPTGGRSVCMIETFGTRRQLERGYQRWHQLASRGGITSPVPIELLNPGGKCRILSIEPLHDGPHGKAGEKRGE